MLEVRWRKDRFFVVYPQGRQKKYGSMGVWEYGSTLTASGGTWDRQGGGTIY